MKQELIDQLAAKYPILYRPATLHPHPEPRIECIMDGWFDLIDRMSAKLEAELVKLQAASIQELPELFRMREKFGLLRVGIWHKTPAMQEITLEASAESASICEACGQPGELRIGGWIRALCERHALRYGHAPDHNGEVRPLKEPFDTFMMHVAVEELKLSHGWVRLWRRPDIEDKGRRDYEIRYSDLGHDLAQAATRAGTGIGGSCSYQDFQRFLYGPWPAARRALGLPVPVPGQYYPDRWILPWEQDKENQEGSIYLHGATIPVWRPAAVHLEDVPTALAGEFMKWAEGSTFDEAGAHLQDFLDFLQQCRRGGAWDRFSPVVDAYMQLYVFLAVVTSDPSPESRLASVGMVTMDGREFFAHGENMAGQVQAWLADLGPGVMMLSDFAAEDTYIMSRLMSKGWPSNVKRRIGDLQRRGISRPDCFDQAREEYLAKHSDLNHALDSARALRHAYLATKANVAGWWPEL